MCVMSFAVQCLWHVLLLVPPSVSCPVLCCCHQQQYAFAKRRMHNLWCCLQKIDAEEAAIWEEMLSAANMVEEEAKQRYRKAKESKEVCLQFVATEMWSVTHDSEMATTRLWVSSLGVGFNIDLHNFLRTTKDALSHLKLHLSTILSHVACPQYIFLLSGQPGAAHLCLLS